MGNVPKHLVRLHILIVLLEAAVGRSDAAAEGYIDLKGHAACPQVYLITELLLGGELLDAVLARGSYNEADARSCAVQLLRGIEYLHSRCAGVAPYRAW